MQISTLWDKIKEMIKNMVGAKSVEQVLKVTPVISSAMSEAIDLWDRMYKDESPWLHEPSYNDPTKVVSLGLPAFIASEKARMAVLELKSEVTTPTEEVDELNPNYEPIEPTPENPFPINTQPETIKKDKPIGDTARAEYLNKQYEKVLKKIRNQLEYGIASGGLIIKPYVVENKKSVIKNDQVIEGEQETNTEIEFDYIHADSFFPLSFDGSGKVTEAAFIQTKADKDTVYRRLEYHKLEGNTVKVSNKAFKSTNNSMTMNVQGDTDLGKEVPLSEVPEWKDLAPEVTIGNVDRLLFAYFKMPIANTIDTHSPLGVSGFSRAVKLIKEADLQYSRLLWEFEGGELAIDIDLDAMNFKNKDESGNPVPSMNNLQNRLFRSIDLGESNTYQPYSPALRDASFINGLNTILMRIEDVCALSRGTLSDVAAEARTATELKILKQRSYSANEEIQKALQTTLEDVVYIMNVYCDLYEITTSGEYDISFEWDDSILVDVNEELNKRLQLMHDGLTSKVETRMWYFGETEAQAREKLLEIDEETQKAIEQNMAQQQKMFGKPEGVE